MQKSGTRSISDSDAGLVIDTNHLSRYYGKGRATSISCRHILQVCTTSHIRKCAKSLPVWRGGTMVLAEQPHWPQPFLWPPVISVICCSTSGQYRALIWSPRNLKIFFAGIPQGPLEISPGTIRIIQKRSQGPRARGF